MTPDAGAVRQFAKPGIDQQLAAAAFNDRRLFRRAPACHQLFPLLGCRVVPGERNEILEKEFAHEHRVAAFARTDDLQVPARPPGSSSRRRSWTAISIFSLSCGTLFSISRNRAPGTRINRVRPRAMPVTMTGRRVSRSMSPANCPGPCVTTCRLSSEGFNISIAPDSTTNKSRSASPARKTIWPSSKRAGFGQRLQRRQVVGVKLRKGDRVGCWC